MRPAAALRNWPPDRVPSAALEAALARRRVFVSRDADEDAGLGFPRGRRERCPRLSSACHAELAAAGDAADRRRGLARGDAEVLRIERVDLVEEAAARR